LRLFGAGVRARVTLDLVKWQFDGRFDVEGAYDDAIPAGHVVHGDLRVLGSTDQGLRDARNDPSCAFLVTFGTRASIGACRVFRGLIDGGAHVPSLIAPGAAVSPSARLGRNTIVPPGVFVGAGVTIGDLVVMHGGVAIEHDCRIGNNVLLAPGVSLAGAVIVEDHCFFGVGASVMPEVTIGTGALLGAGAVATRAVATHSVVVGQPARRLRETRAGMEVPTAEDIARFGTWPQREVTSGR
jgi:sugar O-acyltransferase (sialic acid O-acetyltransferase NeuD family)